MVDKKKYIKCITSSTTVVLPHEIYLGTCSLLCHFHILLFLQIYKEVFYVTQYKKPQKKYDKRIQHQTINEATFSGK